MQRLNQNLIKKTQASFFLLGFLFISSSGCSFLKKENHDIKNLTAKETFVYENKKETPILNDKNIEESSYNTERRNEMEVILSSTLGSVFYTITVFVAGALIGNPLWNWASKKFPWNK